MTQITYHGKRSALDQLENEVWVVTDLKRADLPLCLDIRNHSPTGFEWGYAGSGPAQLALAILAHATGQTTALKHYMAFKNEVIARLPKAGWSITHNQVLDFIIKQKEQQS